MTFSPSLTVRCQLPEGMLGLGPEPVRLSWRVSGAKQDATQVAYEIQVSSSPAFKDLLATTGEVNGDEQVGIGAPGGPMRSREMRHYRVRVATVDGWTDWSPTLSVEAGLLDASEWLAEAISLPNDDGALHQAPSPLLRHEFDLSDGVARARLHVTSLGVNKMWINGQAVSDEWLNPGWSSYAQRLLSATYDVQLLLARGQNVIAGSLGDGWYRGRLGWDPTVGDRSRYGSELALIAQLEITLDDGSELVVATNGEWRTSTGEIRRADLYDGSAIDYRNAQHGWRLAGFDAEGWERASIVPFDPAVIQPRSAPPVRVIATLPTAVVRRDENKVILDGGQNLAGVVRLHVRGREGEQVVVRHAEVLEKDGSIHTRSLRSAKATDSYVLANGGPALLEPEFTFHGFRYVEVDTAADLVSAEIHALSSDLERRGWFECSDALINRLHENVVWSQSANFVSVPTDCPQRDERLGWTGDAQAFAPTACTLFESEQFWASWLEDLALDQDDVLGVPSVVPDVVLDGELRYGRAGWADAATFVPWAVYESYGDARILSRQFDSMATWVDSLVRRRGDDRLLSAGAQFGDWLDPDAPPDRPWEAKADPTFLANAFFSRSARLVAAAAETLGDTNLSSRYQQVGDEVADGTWNEWRDHIIETQTGCAVALSFDIVPMAERARIQSALARLVVQSDGRVATGFLGTPLVLHALAAANMFDEAYRMLLRRQHPSWLYQVEMGATTVWERWDAIRPDGSIHPGVMAPPPGMEDQEGAGGHMLSFNHYAYGAVVDWVYRHLAGLAPVRARPGYRHVVFAPKPVTGIDWARATVNGPFGPVVTSWDLDDAMTVDLELPFGSTGTFIAPVTEDSEVKLDGSPAGGSRTELGPGTHQITVTKPLVAYPN